ncbi:MAG TPA: amidohydrolase family protein [Ilumatobacter sp.]|nr:amidohydrolase family protein [Ilumatobacter sp.]
MLDLIIRNGVVVDGTGSERRHADIGVLDGRITAIGDIDDSSARVVDADGRIVSPGFVDVHTHLDAQAFWDPDLSPTPLHGVTSVFSGNCGFTIAPLNAAAGEYLMPMLAKVEGMPLQSLREGVPWNWQSTADYLDALDGQLVINAGFMVGHSAIRRVVMGAAATDRAATADELDGMCALLRAGLAAGGIGFSTTTSDTHNDADGNAVPSRLADRAEMLALATVCGEFEGTSLELLPRGATGLGPFDDDVAELMVAMSVAARRPLNWNVISPTSGNLDSCLSKLEVGDAAAAAGGKVVGLTMPVDMKARFSFHAGFVLELFDGWSEIMNASTDAKMRAFADPAQRARYRELAEGTANLRHLTKWHDLVLVETFAESTARFAGMRVGDVSEILGCDPFNALIDVVIADDMRTTFTRESRPPTQADWDARLRVWQDPRALIGASDAGAHLDMIAAFRYSTGFLQEAVREQRLLPLERAVQMLTQAPARLYGVRDRGTLCVGGKADVLVFDEDTIGSEAVATRFDLPGGAGRLYADPIGIDHVFCNGVEIAAGGGYTGQRSGVILRSGRDTMTPTMDL